MGMNSRTPICLFLLCVIAVQLRTCEARQLNVTTPFGDFKYGHVILYSAGRSGTTLMRSLLSQHPNFVDLGDILCGRSPGLLNQYLASSPGGYKKARTACGKVDCNENEAAVVQYMQHLFQGSLEKNYANDPEKVFVLPVKPRSCPEIGISQTEYFSILQRFFGFRHLVAIARNPFQHDISALSSLSSNRHVRDGSTSRCRPILLSSSVDHLVRSWKLREQVFHQAVHKNAGYRVLRLTYEHNIYGHPVDAFDEIVDFVGINDHPPPAKVVAHVKTVVPAPVSHTAPHTPRVEEPHAVPATALRGHSGEVEAPVALPAVEDDHTLHGSGGGVEDAVRASAAADAPEVHHEPVPAFPVDAVVAGAEGDGTDAAAQLPGEHDGRYRPAEKDAEGNEFMPAIQPPVDNQEPPRASNADVYPNPGVNAIDNERLPAVHDVQDGNFAAADDVGGVPRPLPVPLRGGDMEGDIHNADNADSSPSAAAANATIAVSEGGNSTSDEYERSAVNDGAAIPEERHAIPVHPIVEEGDDIPAAIDGNNHDEVQVATIQPGIEEEGGVPAAVNGDDDATVGTADVGNVTASVTDGGNSTSYDYESTAVKDDVDNHHSDNEAGPQAHIPGDSGSTRAAIDDAENNPSSANSRSGTAAVAATSVNAVSAGSGTSRPADGSDRRSVDIPVAGNRRRLHQIHPAYSSSGSGVRIRPQVSSRVTVSCPPAELILNYAALVDSIHDCAPFFDWAMANHINTTSAFADHLWARIDAAKPYDIGPVSDYDEFLSREEIRLVTNYYHLHPDVRRTGHSECHFDSDTDAEVVDGRV